MELQKTKHQMQPKNGNMCLLHLYKLQIREITTPAIIYWVIDPSSSEIFVGILISTRVP